MAAVTLSINRRNQTVDADPSTPLLWALRDELGMARSAPAHGARGEREDEILRQAISDVGAEVLRLTKALEREEAAEDAPAERVQRLQKRASRASSMA